MLDMKQLVKFSKFDDSSSGWKTLVCKFACSKLVLCFSSAQTIVANCPLITMSHIQSGYIPIYVYPTIVHRRQSIGIQTTMIMCVQCFIKKCFFWSNVTRAVRTIRMLFVSSLSLTFTVYLNFYAYIFFRKLP